MVTKERKTKELRREKRQLKQNLMSTPQKSNQRETNTQIAKHYKSNLSDEQKELAKKKDKTYRRKIRNQLDMPLRNLERIKNTTNRGVARSILDAEALSKIKECDRLNKEKKLEHETKDDRQKRLERCYQNRKIRKTNSLPEILNSCRSNGEAPTETRQERIKSPTPTRPELHNFYFERQINNLCGLHALNNGLQGKYFKKEDLDEAATELDTLERTMYPARDNNYDQTGNYNISVLEKALQKKKFTVVESTHMLNLIRNNKQAAIFLFTVNNHHVSIRRFYLNGPWVLFDSLHHGPQIKVDFWDDICRDVNNRTPFHIYEIRFTEDTECKVI